MGDQRNELRVVGQEAHAVVGSLESYLGFKGRITRLLQLLVHERVQGVHSSLDLRDNLLLSFDVRLVLLGYLHFIKV